MMATTDAILVHNVTEYEVLPHPLVVLDGVVNAMPSLMLSPEEWFIEARLDASRFCYFPVTATGRFKALVLLPAPGKYEVTLRMGMHCSRVLNIEYRPPVSRYVVKFYYQKSADGHSHGFDAPPGTDNSDRAAMDKIRFNALLLQTATAEMFRNAGLPRKTFAVEFATDGLPMVHLLQTTFTNEHARSIHDQELIKLVEKDIKAGGFDNHHELEFKHAVILGCSTFNPSTQKPEGHTALGGGKVGIFGSCGLHTWPRHLGEVSACCLNNSRIDKSHLFDDSAYRGTFWANFSTGIGAFIHELGHTFGLGHSTTGIMGRGFDDMNHLFCAFEADHHVHEPAFYHDFGDGRLHLNHQVLKEVTGPNGAHWHMGSALQLIHCPWIAGEAKRSTRGPSVRWNKNIRGPVGYGTYDGEQKDFNQKHEDVERVDLGAVKIRANSFMEKIKCYTRSQIASKSAKNIRSTDDKYWLVLQDNEYVTRVEVRAMCWIDGMRIHTNLRSTRWFGGFGGQLHVLQPDEGFKIHGFFGSRGNSYVGKLGVYCSPITENAPTLPGSRSYVPVSGTIGTIDKVGLGYAEGPHQDFSYRDIPIAAVAIKCGDFVDNIRLVTPEEHNAGSTETDRETYVMGEHVWALLPGEYIVNVQVRSGHWLDAVRFKTNLRKSPWFGGDGGEKHKLVGPTGTRISGIYGTRGASVVDSLGGFYCAITNSDSVPLPQVMHQLSALSDIPFSLLGATQQVPPIIMGDAPFASNARGVVVAVQDNRVQYVNSFDSMEAKQNLVRELETFVYAGAQLFSFSLRSGESLIQMDASVDYSTGSPAIVGVCFHSSTRCSSWFGTYIDTSLHFVMAPHGSVIKSVRSSPGASSVVDLLGEFSPRSSPSSVEMYEINGVREDAGTYDIRLVSQSDFGIESVLLLKKRNDEDLDHHAWQWKQPHVPYPQRWCLPQKMLEYHVHDDREGTDKKTLLHREYVVGGVDVGGAFSKAGSPPRL
ncbi:hypothetical protein Poli38472_002260 [Pythium oligandrum]|uniref:Jacalin-type lectin domain-containing protein n=1 Tax=Pythium oligandrum TaxID=41045 RepID=A0A8K1CHT7_PYTOL|nr:hypothetical protein Poli38472_002260 [Pythium oligandrum]|eukprot:TMW63319.1 hypothetical protein Poli38472_002260 [Pythium oligandrum]